MAGDGSDPITLEHVADLPIRLPATAVDVSPDGRWLAVMTVGGVYVLRIDGDPANAATAAAAHVRLVNAATEAVTFILDGTGLLATTEDGHVILFPAAKFGMVDPATKPVGRVVE